MDLREIDRYLSEQTGEKVAQREVRESAQSANPLESGDSGQGVPPGCSDVHVQGGSEYASEPW